MRHGKPLPTDVKELAAVSLGDAGGVRQRMLIIAARRELGLALNKRVRKEFGGLPAEQIEEMERERKKGMWKAKVSEEIKRQLTLCPKRAAKIASSMITKAGLGSVPHATLLLQYSEGKPKQQVDVDVEDFTVNLKLVED